MPAPLDLKAVLEELERTAPGASRVLLLAAATPGRRVVWPWVEGLVPDLTDDARAAVRHLLEVRGLARDGADPPGATGTLGQEVAEAATPLLTDENATIDRYVIDRAEQVAEDQAGFPEPWEVDALLGVLSRPLGSNPGLVTQIPQFLRSVALAAPEDTRLRTILLDACIKLAGTGTRAEAEANARLADALHTTDLATRVLRDRVLERTAGDGQQDADGHGPRVVDLDRFDHAEIGDRTAELGVDDSAEGLTNCVFGGCGHDAILSGRVRWPSWCAARWRGSSRSGCGLGAGSGAGRVRGPCCAPGAHGLRRSVAASPARPAPRRAPP